MNYKERIRGHEQVFINREYLKAVVRKIAEVREIFVDLTRIWRSQPEAALR